MANKSSKEKSPKEELEEFLQEKGYTIDVPMAPSAEETRSGKLIIEVEPRVVVRKKE